MVVEVLGKTNEIPSLLGHEFADLTGAYLGLGVFVKGDLDAHD